MSEIDQLELTVAPEDLGRVIGKRGATAQSLRTLLRALGTKNDARYNLKIVDNGVNSQSRESTDDKSSDESSSEEPVMPDEPNSTSDAKEEPAATETQEEQTSDRLKQAREELADLDDLDV
jgi:hypothetical protein